MEDRLYGRVLCIYTPQYFVLNIGSIEQIRLNESLKNIIDDICKKITRPDRCEDDFNLEGSIVFAFNSLFNKWARAFVISSKKGILKCNIRLTAYYLDFGNSANISLKDIIPFTSVMSSLTSDVLLKTLNDPLKSFPVTLANIQPLSGKFWSTDAIEKFVKIVRNTIFEVLIIECSSFGPAKVNLIPTTLSPNSLDNENDSNIQDIKQTSVSELLIHLTLAKYKEDKCKGVSDIIDCNKDASTGSFISRHLSRYRPIPIFQENEQNLITPTSSPKSVENKPELDQCAMSQNASPICPFVKKVVSDLMDHVRMATLKMPVAQLVKQREKFRQSKKGKIIKYDRETLMRLGKKGAGHFDWSIINELDDFALINPMVGPIFIRSPKAKAARLKALEKCNNVTPTKPKGAKQSEERVLKYGALELKELRSVTSSSHDLVSVRVRQNLAKFALQNLACIKAANKLNTNANQPVSQHHVKDQETSSRPIKKVKADRLRQRTTSMQLPAKDGTSNQCPVDRKSFSSGVGKPMDNRTSTSKGNNKKKDLNLKCIEAATKKENGGKTGRNKETPVKKSQKEVVSKSVKKSQGITKSSENLLTMVGCGRDQEEGLDLKSRSESKKPVVNRVGGTGWNFLKSFSRLLGNSDASAQLNILSSSSSSSSSLSSKSSQYPPPPSLMIASQTSSSVKKTKTRNRGKNSGVVRAKSATPPTKNEAAIKSDAGQKVKILNKQSLNPIKPTKESTAQATAKTVTYTKLDFDDLNPPSVYTPLKREDLVPRNNDKTSQTSSDKKKDRNKYRHLVGVEKSLKHLYENTGPAVKLDTSPLKEILLPSTSNSRHTKVRESVQKTPQQTMKKIDISDIFNPPSQRLVNNVSPLRHEYRPYKLWHYGDEFSGPTTRQQHIPLNVPRPHTPHPIFTEQPNAPSRPVPIFASPQPLIPSLKPILGFRSPKVRPGLSLNNSSPVFHSYPNGYVNNGPTPVPSQSRHRHDSENLILNHSIQQPYGFYSPPLIKRRTPGATPGPPQPGSGEYFLPYRSGEAQTRGTMYPTYDYEDTFREMYR